MNEYKITYTSELTPAGETGPFTQFVTDRTETAAKKFFNSSAKELGRKFQSIELIRTDAPATKRNERDTLEVIRQMVADLGPQSYLATAFEGCFEDAENNIECDFGDSYKRRCDSLEERLAEAKQEAKELKEQLEESRKDWEAAHAANHALAEQKDAEIAALQGKVLSPDDLTDAIQLVTEKQFDLETKVKEAAQQIVDTATEPESAEFQYAVDLHRASKSQLDYYTALLERLTMAADR